MSTTHGNTTDVHRQYTGIIVATLGSLLLVAAVLGCRHVVENRLAELLLDRGFGDAGNVSEPAGFIVRGLWWPMLLLAVGSMMLTRGIGSVLESRRHRAASPVIERKR